MVIQSAQYFSTGITCMGYPAALRQATSLILFVHGIVELTSDKCERYRKSKIQDFFHSWLSLTSSFLKVFYCSATRKAIITKQGQEFGKK